MWTTIAWTATKTFFSNQLNTLSYALIGALILALGWSASLKWEVWDLKSDLSTCKDEKAKVLEENGLLITDKKLYEQAIAQGKENQKEKIVYVDREIGKVEVQTKEIIKTVKEYVYDQNKTKCENGMARIRRTGF